MDNKELEFGHIVCVRYSWNTYVGEVRPEGLCATGALQYAFFSPHAFNRSATYQILGHVDQSHPDYKDYILDWYKSEKERRCPINIRVWDNVQLKD